MIKVFGARTGINCFTVGITEFMGVEIMIKLQSANDLLSGLIISSIIPIFYARCVRFRSLHEPKIDILLPNAFFKPKAIELPIKPTPMIVIFFGKLKVILFL